MKLKFVRTNDTIETKILINDDEMDFEYLRFINQLIDGEQLEETIYPNNVSDGEKKEIDEMVKQINDILVENEI
jgi:hypothetical protein